VVYRLLRRLGVRAHLELARRDDDKLHAIWAIAKRFARPIHHAFDADRQCEYRKHLLNPDESADDLTSSDVNTPSIARAISFMLDLATITSKLHTKREQRAAAGTICRMGSRDLKTEA
jgi:hypothetical protein